MLTCADPTAHHKNMLRPAASHTIVVKHLKLQKLLTNDQEEKLTVWFYIKQNQAVLCPRVLFIEWVET